MIDFGLLSEQISEVKSFNSALENDIKKLGEEVEIKNRKNLLNLANRIYISSANVALTARKIVRILTSFGEEMEIMNALNEEITGIKTDAKYDEKNEIFSCKLLSPPPIKSASASHKFVELICLPLQHEIIKILPSNFKKFDSAYVIFLNHFNAKLPPKKQPYFDNDNLAIKEILDAIVPHICIDDAAIFCDNLYLCQPDDNDFVEVFVVKKGSLLKWISSQKGIGFASEFESLLTPENQENRHAK